MQEEANSYWPQPLTFGGVAAFAPASTGRLLLFQAAIALLAALAVAFLFESACVPVITQTIQGLPASGAIVDGQLSWTQARPLRTVGSTFLWISIDPGDTLEPSEGADLEVELGKHQLRVRSVFGYLAVPYPNGYTIALNRNEVEPWWGAWHPAVTTGLGAATLVGLLVIWEILASLYAWPVRLISFYADRDLSWSGAWRLAAAALLSGAMFLVLALVAYACHQLNLMQLLAAAVLHFMIGWVYVLFAPFGLPRCVHTASAQPANPFKPTTPGQPDDPFAGPSQESKKSPP
jgi:hypothetical protein